MGGEHLHRLLLEGADHDRIDHARDDPRAVLDRLAASELGVARREEERMTAELDHAGLEGDAGAGRGLLEDHRQRPAGERLEVLAGGAHPLEFSGARDQRSGLVQAQIEQ
jgi:hypothetical protein